MFYFIFCFLIKNKESLRREKKYASGLLKITKLYTVKVYTKENKKKKEEEN